ncbi:MAG: hypothetical protein GC164_08795 [Phycisphaera sp.]|nr:hypothetical protein [Phycisphaera sp.]
MLRDDVLHILAEHKEELTRKGVVTLSVFGSTARDEAGPDSDVDLLVELDPNDRPFGLFRFIALQHFIEDLLGCKVDLVEKSALRSELKDEVLREAIRAAWISPRTTARHGQCDPGDSHLHVWPVLRRGRLRSAMPRRGALPLFNSR